MNLIGEPELDHRPPSRDPSEVPRGTAIKLPCIPYRGSSDASVGPF